MTKILTTILAIAAGAAGAAAPVAEFDFTRPGAAEGWRAAHHIASMRPTAEGLAVRARGEDPYLIGPPVTATGDGPLWLRIRWRSDTGGGFQIFPGPPFDEATSVRGRLPAGRWCEQRIPLDPQKPGLQIRIDPPGATGEVVIASLRLEPRLVLVPPAWPAAAPAPAGARERVEAGVLAAGAADAGLAVEVGGESMAVADDRVVVGYLSAGAPRWFCVATAAVERTVRREGDAVVRQTRARDPDGATWTFETRLAAAKPEGTIALDAAVTVDADREILCLPLLLVRPGAGSFGERKTQGLFAGLEYLDDEPSSSTADIEGPGSRRLAPRPHKVTLPLMAIAARDRYIGLAWEPQPLLQPVFDSPDRTFGGGAHAMGLFLLDGRTPGRDEGSAICDPPLPLRAGGTVTAKARLVGGRGGSVVPAVRHYVALEGLPPLPDSGFDRAAYAALAADGWLNSGIRDGARFLHCVWGERTAQPAADVPAHLRWLAGAVADPALAGRLRGLADEAAGEVPPENYMFARVGHGRTVAPPLLLGHVLTNATAAARSARQQLAQFAADGTVPYRPRKGKPDYGRTHPVPHANGMAALAVEMALRMASFAGDRALLDEALGRLRGLAHYRNGVPRGAQTWEIPLHTPDILAAAHLVAAYTRGYELTGDRALLDEAVYWAWTGVPFVYLVPPTAGPIGAYGTIAVLGATNWRAPVWFGQPVQWCGLVYAGSLYELARHDDAGPWKRLADGITVAGIQHTWPAADRKRVGLLPDFVLLEDQHRDGPAINPLTVGLCAARLFGGPALDDFRCAGGPRWLVHAPGDLAPVREDARSAELRVTAWPDGGGFVLVGGLAAGDKVLLDGRPVPREAPNTWDPARGLLALRVDGGAILRLERPD
jgi:hypothetical protein